MATKKHEREMTLLDFYMFLEELSDFYKKGINYRRNNFTKALYTGKRPNEEYTPSELNICTLTDYDFLSKIETFPKDIIKNYIKDLTNFISTFKFFNEIKISFTDSDLFTLKYHLYYNIKENSVPELFTSLYINNIEIEHYLQRNKENLYNERLANIVINNKKIQWTYFTLLKIDDYGLGLKSQLIPDIILFLKNFIDSSSYNVDSMLIKNFNLTLIRFNKNDIQLWNKNFLKLLEIDIPRLYIYLNVVTSDYVTLDELEEKNKIMQDFKKLVNTCIKYCEVNKEYTSKWLNKFLNQRATFNYATDQSHITYINPYKLQGNGKSVCFKYVYRYLLEEINSGIDIQEKYGINDKTLTSLLTYSMK